MSSSAVAPIYSGWDIKRDHVHRRVTTTGFELNLPRHRGKRHYNRREISCTPDSCLEKQIKSTVVCGICTLLSRPNGLGWTTPS